MAGQFTFSKIERLSSRTDIQNLFDSANSHFIYPFKVVWKKADAPKCKFPAKVLISVPKRNHKTAVARNRIKRLFREAYRLNKHLLYKELIDSDMQINLAFIYVSKEILSYDEILKSVDSNISRLVKDIRESNIKIK
ncbi:MAG: ribonuclease P protein component [Bacteroidales bacterium]|nr:ribonuclease P protein component [Bacteroidales bacterium]